MHTPKTRLEAAAYCVFLEQTQSILEQCGEETAENTITDHYTLYDDTLPVRNTV